MTREEILINNKLIAEFMGENYLLPNGTGDNVPISEWRNPNSLLFHKSWDWLMPVVHKILFDTNINSRNEDEWSSLIKNIQSALGNCEITNLFDTVIEFIKWYNKQSQL